MAATTHRDLRGEPEYTPALVIPEDPPRRTSLDASGNVNQQQIPSARSPGVELFDRPISSPTPDNPRNQVQNFSKPNAMEDPPLNQPKYRQTLVTHEVVHHIAQPQRAIISSGDSAHSDDSVLNDRVDSPTSSQGSQQSGQVPQFHYHHQEYEENSQSNGPNGYQQPPRGSSLGVSEVSQRHLAPHARPSPRPSSAYSGLSERTRSPQSAVSPYSHARAVSAYSAGSRNSSVFDLPHLNYQTPAPNVSYSHAQLRSQVGINASLMSQKQTLEMYRMNAKKTQDPQIQYDFALFMIEVAMQADESDSKRDLDSPFVDNSTSDSKRNEFLKEARQILQKLADRGYPQAQYYFGDALSTGLLTAGKIDLEKSFYLFVAASKHGHAEAGYRAALCYEYGWGCKRDYAKAVQFFRASASKSHPGAMLRLGLACLHDELGITGKQKEAVTWLKRGAEFADHQYPSAPYELGLLHERGFGEDVFADASYAAQLFTQAAELGHAEANYRLGDAYEHGLLNCPRDAALSVHFYTGAAAKEHAAAMMALCAWYMVGAEPVLEKNEEEAYEWARRAGYLGFPKAEYAIGYFTEMGIGCRRDALEARVWYVRAADHGDERAIKRLAHIDAAATSGGASSNRKGGKKDKMGSPKGEKDDKDCVIM